jgi:flagellar protein FliS
MITDAYLETRVLTADPIELTHMLYQRAIDLVEDARQGLRTGDVMARATAITKLVAIVGELDGSLNHEAGGEISQRLSSLYGYMLQRITFANAMKQDQPLAEVGALLQTLAEAWESVRPAAVSTPPTGTWNPQFQPVPEFASASQEWSA